MVDEDVNDDGDDEDIGDDTIIVNDPETVIPDIADALIEPLALVPRSPETPAPRKSSRATSKPVRLGTILAGKMSNKRSVTTEPSLPEPPMLEPPPELPPPEPPPPL